MEDAAAIASVSLRPLEGMEAVNVAAAPSQACNGVALAALLKLCNGWQKPDALLQGQCILVSQTKFEVDISYNADVIAAFKQMPTKNYGNRRLVIICFLILFYFLFFMDAGSFFLVLCCRHADKKVELFT